MPIDNPKRVQSQEILDSVNEVLTNQVINLSMLHYQHLEKDQVFLGHMQTENVINCEASVDLWEKVLYSSISDITNDTYPHYSVIKKIINYVLNEFSTTDFGLTIELFSKLIMFHPPGRINMRQYYERILFDHYITVNEREIEEHNLLLFLIENLSLYGKDKEIFEDIDDWPSVSESENISAMVLESITYMNENRSSNSLSKFQTLNDRKVMFFEKLNAAEKVKRCFVCLKFVCDILEADIHNWFKAYLSRKFLFEKDSRPLLSCIIWENLREIGAVNQLVRKICLIYDQLQDVKSPQIVTIHRLMSLVAEVIRYTDASEYPMYPFLGKNCDALSRELAMRILERIKDRKKEVVADLTINLKPSWFKLLVCCNVLSILTGNQCTPELISAAEILEHVEEVENAICKSETREEKKIKANPNIVARFKRLKSVNSKLVTGKTRLHNACQQNKIEEVRALLTFSELDVNTTDHEGWTALHEAAFKGQSACVKELLQFRPLLEEVQRSVDARARDGEGLTPLMCAVLGDHVEVCQLLLQHSGSVLLEDVTDDNKTPIELAKSQAVINVLQHYQKNKIVTENSKKKMNFTAGKLDNVITLCIQMVESYFLTHRTWDVYHSMKKKKEIDLKAKRTKIISGIKFNYARYHRDIKTNLPKLRSVLYKLKKKNEDAKELLIEPLFFVLFLNKSH